MASNTSPITNRCTTNIDKQGIRILNVDAGKCFVMMSTNGAMIYGYDDDKVGGRKDELKWRFLKLKNQTVKK